MQRITIDMNEMLADRTAHQLTWCERDLQPGPGFAELHGTHLSRVVPDLHRARIHEHTSDPTFFRDTPLMSGAVQSVVALSERYEIFVASAVMEHPVSCNARFEWLREHWQTIPPVHCIFCGDKSVIGTDYLIADSGNTLKTARTAIEERIRFSPLPRCIQ